jgi:hypothetical protein
MKCNNYSDSEPEDHLLALADNMASAATTFNSHGYEIFLQARTQFIKELHELLHPERDTL